MAAQFAPAVECLEHRPAEPDQMYDDYTADLERFDSSGVGGDSGSLSSNQTEKLSDENSASDAVGSHVAGEPNTAAHSRPNQTTTDVNQRGRAILITTPRIVSDAGASKPTRKGP